MFTQILSPSPAQKQSVEKHLESYKKEIRLTNFRCYPKGRIWWKSYQGQKCWQPPLKKNQLFLWLVKLLCMMYTGLTFNPLVHDLSESNFNLLVPMTKTKNVVFRNKVVDMKMK